MGKFIIKGGTKLHGTLTPEGAKNEALQVISATLLTEERVTIENVPEILDITKLISLLEGMGVEITHPSKGVFTFCAKNLNREYFNSKEYYKKAAALRGSILIVGPLLARLGYVVVPKPGGDKIGRRRLDTHFLGFEQLGAEFSYDADECLFRASANELTGKYMLLDEASVTGTANIIMAAVMAKGTRRLHERGV